MIAFKDMSIRRKLLFLTLSVTVLSGSIGTIVDIYQEYIFVKETLVDQSLMNAKLMSEYCITPLDFGYVDEAVENISKLEKIPQVYNAHIYDKHGFLFGAYNRYMEVLVHEIPMEDNYSYFDDDWLHVFHKIIYKDSFKGTIYLRVSKDELDRTLYSHLASMLIIGGMVLGVAIVLTIKMQHVISTPILKLTEQTELISDKGDYSIRVDKPGDDEIGILYDGFNNMLDQIETSEKERDIAEFALKESEEKYRMLFERSNDAIFLVDIDSGKYLDVNNAAELLVGRARKEILDLTTQDISPEGSEQRIDQLRKSEVSTDFSEVEYVQPDGTIRTALLNTVHLEGSIYYGIARDITDRKNAELERLAIERQLSQSQKLEAVGVMVGGISHELNNILQSMFLYTGLILDDLPENSELRENFQHLVEDSERARDIVKQILTFSRKSKIEYEPRTIQKIVLEALMFERASIPPNINIKHDIDLNCGRIICDKTQIHQIVLNLCNNAKYAIGEDQGTITVTLKQIETSIGEIIPSDGVLELSVSDTGAGMTLETQEKIFDPFFTTKDVGEGTGLGLSVIHGIVDSMKGQIIVSSEPGQGTSFRILIPITKKLRETQNPPLKTQVPAEMQTILLVDDESSIRTATAAILRRKGFKVDIAEEGLTALELFEANPEKYDLIVTDQSMPKMSGVELTQEIRNSNFDTPIILSTGNIGIEDQEEYQNVGIDGFIQKPWTASQLIKRLQEIIT